ncbi:hypothetical protein MPTK1_2g24880 [Marchantia polymorpha subsp. ruderalis]|uniref:Uncharacterized protein n=1 Tax=Marchantia polymorpha TaxID=3197 RepID=A0A2R6W1Y1_MARPO|nr:hypothetical protein MARPO_0181s0009 [Marchantia polymorpha]BBN03614.1 hypothetical protein Mp_2g24880 [Marchantia polymorpha subsp. ruderalis]|eukprot:PTQ27861.1 hypothetical protein MARPO_0181s0009 [Marchantia polymorpha]
MELAVARIMSTGLESPTLRAGGACGSGIHLFTPLSITAPTLTQCRTNVRLNHHTSPSVDWSCSQHSSAGASACAAASRGLRDDRRSPAFRTRRLQSVASFSSGGRGENDLPHNSCVDQIREHNIRSPSRLDSRVGGGEHPSRNIDRQSASAAGISNAFTLVEQARRSSPPLILTDDSRRHTSHFERTEADSACQKSLVSPGTISDPLKQLCVAVDVDEVLGSFLATLNEFMAEEYLLHHDVSEYYIYDFMKIWKCSQAEANHRVHAFFESKHFKNGIRPVPGAYQTLLHLAAYCNLVVVTSRQHVIREPTLEWIERYYSGIFKEVHFGNHFALEGSARPKSEICRSLGAHILIDDNPRYAMECAECGIEVLLFDFHGSYPWSKTPCGPQHPLITRVKDWKEVERALLARTFVEL